jgi:hypothetical protein
VAYEALTDHAEMFDYKRAEHSGAVVRLPQFDVELLDRRELCREFEQPHRLDPMRQRRTLRSGIDDQPADGLEIIAGDVKSAFDLGRQAALDLNGPKLGTGQFQQQVDLGAGRGSVIEG